MKAVSILLSAWACYFTSFFLAALACGVISRRGFLPLHIPAIIGVGAYAFAGFAGRGGISPLVSALGALLGASVFGAFTGLLFIRLRGASAALATIAIQLAFDQYAQSAEWTGGSAGLWQGIPVLPPTQKLIVCAIVIAICSFLYRCYQHAAVARQVTADGISPTLYKSVSTISSTRPLVAASTLLGFIGGCAGLVIPLQMGFISPSSFSLHLGLLYVGIVLLVGHERIFAIAIGSLFVSILPEMLRILGFGSVETSAWRSVIVGLAVLAVVLLQAPRASFASAGCAEATTK
jgi:branched-chain amino acid transport system permease protein